MKNLFIASALALVVANTVATPLEPSVWQPSWISSPQAVWGADWVVPLGMPASLHDVTLRQELRSSLGGDRLRLVLSNEYSATPLRVGAVAIRGLSNRLTAPVRFQGNESVVVAPGARVTSDEVSLPIEAGDRVSVDVYLPQQTATAGFHWDAQEQMLILQGNAAGQRGGEPIQTASTRAFVSELLVSSNKPPVTVVAFGDSITDGNGSTIGQDERWPDHLARRLSSQGVAVLNAGIAGNRLLTGGWGKSGLARFERDVLSHPGARAVIILLGTNDIGMPGSPFAPSEAPASLTAMTDAFRQLVERAHARGIRVIAATLPPFEHALEGTPLEGHFSTDKENQRQELNRWIRGASLFDDVADFDAALRDPEHPSRLLPSLDSGDHLHPGDAGYRKMALTVDLQRLLRAQSAEAPR